MPAMKIRFLATADTQDPRLVAVNGAGGVGLLLSDGTQTPLVLGQFNAPLLVSPGQNQLTYYITPVRTMAGLNAGAFQAQIQFQLSYE